MIVYYNILGIILGLYRDNGEHSGNYNIIQGLRSRVQGLEGYCVFRKMGVPNGGKYRAQDLGAHQHDGFFKRGLYGA